MTKSLPGGWCTAKVGEVGAVQLGRQRSPDVHTGSNMRPYLRVANVFEDRIDLGDVMQMHFEPRELPRYELQPGDILLNEGQSRELVGRPAMYRGELPGACFTNSLVRFQASECVDGRFALALFIHWLKSGVFLPQVQVTTNIAHLGAGRFAEMDFPVPPINEQRRIVAKLEALQARSRRARAALDAVPPLLEKFRQSILAAAFRGELTKDWRARQKDIEPATELLKRIRTERRKKWEEAEFAKLNGRGKVRTDDRWKAKFKETAAMDPTGLPELPEGWCWARASDIVAPGTVITYGIVLPGPPQPDGVPYVRGQDIEQGRVLCDQLWRTTPAIASAHSRSELREGDVLLCIIRHLKVAIVPTELDGGNITQGTVRLRPSEAILNTYLAHVLEGPWAQAWMKARYFGNAMPRINVEDAREIPVPLPPREEQLTIVSLLAEKLDLVHRVSATVRDQARSLDALERSIRTRAFSGELVSQDPNDEPAETMLARARSTKGSAPANGVPPKRGRPRTTQSAEQPND